MKCENCNKPATIHLTEIKAGKKVERHLCENCASQSGDVPVKAHTPINELLTNFVMAHSGMQKEMGGACEACGITWAEFRKDGVLGCEKDYNLFEKELAPLLQRAHEGATHHVGKVPARRTEREGGSGLPKRQPQRDLNKLRRELAKAVDGEDYERAASLRDEIKKVEK